MAKGKSNVLRAPTEKETAAISAAKDRVRAGPPRVAICVGANSDGAMTMDGPHSDQEGPVYMMMDALRTTSNGWLSKSLLALANVSKAHGKQPTSDDVNAALAFVSAVEPQNEMEAALAMQMFAAHDMAMHCSIQAKHAQTLEGTQAYGSLATKMSRTFTAQIEALSKLRRGGEQVVRHIHVDNRGGQAVIAKTVNTGGAGNGNVFDQPHETGGVDAGGAAMLGYDPQGNGVPVASDPRPEAVPVARRSKPRRTKG